MKFGSVQFFKCLILSCLFIMIAVPTILCIFLAVDNHRMSQELETVKVINTVPEIEELWVASLEKNVYAEEPDFTIEYQRLYPDLYIERESSFADDVTGVVYLTFDDGPSLLTSKILKVLKEKDVKATFFVVYDDSPASADLLRRIAADGHTIGVHSTCHIYKQIYTSVEAFLADFEKTAVWIEEVTGIKPEIFRFPGGSINTYNQGIYQSLIAEMLRRGYVYYDWNVSSGDASGFTTVNSVIDGVINGSAHHKDKAIVLMHDNAGKKDTLKALPDMIDQLIASGRILLPLNSTVKPVVFGYKD